MTASARTRRSVRMERAQAHAPATDAARCSIGPIFRITHERSRYIFDMWQDRKISREVYDFCLREKHADAALIAKWKKVRHRRGRVRRWRHGLTARLASKVTNACAACSASRPGIITSVRPASAACRRNPCRRTARWSAPIVVAAAALTNTAFALPPSGMARRGPCRCCRRSTPTSTA